MSSHDINVVILTAVMTAAVCWIITGIYAASFANADPLKLNRSEAITSGFSFWLFMIILGPHGFYWVGMMHGHESERQGEDEDEDEVEIDDKIVPWV